MVGALTMPRWICPHAPCNYPEGECSGLCIRDFMLREERRTQDSLTAAAVCFAGVLAIVLIGMLVALVHLLLAWWGR